MHLSPSQISALLRCPRAYEYRYLKRIPTALPIKMLAGRCYHLIVASAAIRKQLFNEIMSDGEITDTFLSRWKGELADKLVYDEMGEERLEATIIDFGDKDPDALKKNTMELAKIYVKTVLTTLDVVAIEKRLKCDVGGILYVGYPDLVTGDKVIDHKLRSRKMSENEVANDIQLTSYALLLGGPITAEFHQAIDTKEKKIEIAAKKVEQEEIDWLKELITLAWRQVETGIFLPNPLSWTCSPDGCGYWLDCRKGWF